MRFDWTNPYRTIRAPLFARNVVATSQPLAAQAGLAMLARGGNAVDAAVATAATLTIVEPCSNGLGSDAFAIVWDGQALQGLNASGVAPAAWDPAYFVRKYGDRVPDTGWDSVTVPGAVAGWAALHGRYGKLPFEQLLEPAIELAERGFGVTPIVQQKWTNQGPMLAQLPGYADAFLPHGRVPEIGERFVLHGAADTLRRIGASQGQDFYHGQTAERLVAHAAAHGGAMTLADLGGFQPIWVDPISIEYRGYRVHEIPPNGQGITALMALGMLSRFELSGYGPDSLEAQHLQIEAIKLAFADVYRWVADERYMTEVGAADLLDAGYLAERARRIDPQRAQVFSQGRPPAGGTVYMSVADEHGMMVSYIQSNYRGFGSGVVVPGTGVSLQNRGAGFSLDAAHPNCVAPGKRPFHTIIPAFLTRDGKPQMSFGVMGGNMQPQGHVQTLVRMIDFGQGLQTACDAPRWKVSSGLKIDLEHTMAAELRHGLQRLGHQFEPVFDPYMDFGSGQFIWRLSDDPDDGYGAASDSRRDGQAVGF
ncbi:MAG: gamma-glutamyltransferase family protein [Burkholderiales bacterium]|nr:MAG: gamma-glutamyltransferase family protein [Burkholderiales bacterium]